MTAGASGLSGSAAGRWARALAAWAIPQEILDAAPESPYGFSVGVFSQTADERLHEDTPSRRRALELLGEGGTVLDVGCGAGAASLPLAGRARRLVGVDESPRMLTELAARAEELNLEHAEVQGRWPDVAGVVEPADVAVCHHVAYNAADLDRLASALTDHARSGVVLELTEEHPMAWTSPFWEALHGLTRPTTPTADDALAVLTELGLEVTVDRWERPFRLERAGPDELVATLRRRLCLPPERDPDIRRVLRDTPLPATRPLVTLSWRAPARH